VNKDFHFNDKPNPDLCVSELSIDTLVIVWPWGTFNLF